VADIPAVDGDPPPGFEYVARAPFVNHVGPIYQGTETAPGTMRLGLRVAEVHCNTLGFMHGGMIATIADSAMARALISKLQRRSVTLKMSLEYMDTVNRNDWLVAESRLVSHDETAAYTECDLKVGHAVKARATGVFRLLRKR
jgi:uncharacterized protein (TIGR00369 family)